MTGDQPFALRQRIPSRKSLVIWLAGAATGLALVGLGAGIVIAGGLFNATASAPHNPAVAVAIHVAFIRSVQVRAADVLAPSRFTVAQVQAGLADYNTSCSGCHGAPGIARAAWANAMEPSPPYLSDTARRWRPRELFWIVGQGVKMTAMPAWAENRSDTQLWNLVAFLEAMPLLSPKDYARMRATTRGISGAKTYR
jgi:mono/diheme cytochrome c family protein